MGSLVPFGCLESHHPNTRRGGVHLEKAFRCQHARTLLSLPLLPLSFPVRDEHGRRSRLTNGLGCRRRHGCKNIWSSLRMLASRPKRNTAPVLGGAVPRARWLPLYIALSPPECEVNTVSLSRFLPAEERCSTISSRDCPIGNLRDRAPGTYLLSVFPAVGPY